MTSQDIDNLDQILDKLDRWYAGLDGDDDDFLDPDEAKAALLKWRDEEVVAELKKYKAAYATDLSTDAYAGLEDRIKHYKGAE